MSDNKVRDLGATVTAYADGQSSVNVSEQNIDGFTDRMKALVKRFGSIAEISRKCGIVESTVRKWVDGISDPSRSRCIALAKGTGVSLLWLVAGQGEMTHEETASQSASQSVRLDLLTVAIQLAEEALEGKTLPPEKRAELVGIIYESQWTA